MTSTLSKFKSPDSIVIPDEHGGIVLSHLSNGRQLLLAEDEANVWFDWHFDRLPQPKASVLLSRLEEGGFAATKPAGRLMDEFPNCWPQLSTRNIKWHQESSDLTILFNSARMTGNNPLLALGPYGSLCWQGISKGWPMRRIQQEALRIFGVDEVAPFFARLARDAFIEFDGQLLRESAMPQMVIKEIPAPKVQFMLHQSRLPWYCLWELCTMCDLRCKVCYLPDFNSRGPSTFDAMRIAESIIQAGVFYVCLLGGEVLLRKDLHLIIQKLRSSGVFVKIITNGQKLTKERATELSAAGINQIEISFDGLSKEKHELSRGPGTFERAIDALRYCREANIPRLGVVLTVHSDNINEMEGIPGFLDSAGVRECYLSPFKQAGLNGSSAPWHPPLQSDIDRLRTRLGRWAELHPDLSVVLLPACTCGRTSVVINSAGEVRLCSFSNTSAGSIIHSSLSDVWKCMGNTAMKPDSLFYCANLKKGRSTHPDGKMNENCAALK